MRPPVTQITLLDNPENIEKITLFNEQITQYNTVKNTLDSKLNTSSASQDSISAAYNRVRSRLLNISEECQNDQTFRAIIAGEFNIEVEYLRRITIDKNYTPLNVPVLSTPPPILPGRRLEHTTIIFDPHAKKRAVIRVFSVGVGVVSFSWALGVVSQVYKEGFNQAIGKAAIPLLISGASLLTGGATYIDLRPRQSGALPNIVVPVLTAGGM